MRVMLRPCKCSKLCLCRLLMLDLCIVFGGDAVSECICIMCSCWPSQRCKHGVAFGSYEAVAFASVLICIYVLLVTDRLSRTTMRLEQCGAFSA